jgi:high affinity Mn2+ porin
MAVCQATVALQGADLREHILRRTLTWLRRTALLPARVVLLTGLACGAAAAAPAEASAETWSAHGQFTLVSQHHAAFRSPYAGANSLTPERSTKETADATLYLGLRLWSGAAFFLNPEIDQGYGLSNTLGVAGYPSGEAYKVGRNRPYLRWNRAYLQQVIGLAGDTETVASGPNALAGSLPANRLTLTAGKLSVADLFDGNTLAHDPRADFLNWSVIESGAFDYAADAWGYSYGAAADLKRGDWSLRLGVFAMSDVPNSVVLDKSFRQHEWVAEVERRHTAWGQPGVLRLLAYLNRADMARYDDAWRLASGAPDLAGVRRRGNKAGVALNAEQQWADSVGTFARLSASDGRLEAYDFTEINRSVAAGVVLQGELWGAAGHRWGMAVAVNAPSGAARRYFDAGGMGILIGDGQLPHAGSEQIFETWYAVPLGTRTTLTADCQRIDNPAYNRDRGPVTLLALRLHADF